MILRIDMEAIYLNLIKLYNCDHKYVEGRQIYEIII